MSSLLDHLLSNPKTRALITKKDPSGREIVDHESKILSWAGSYYNFCYSDGGISSEYCVAYALNKLYSHNYNVKSMEKELWDTNKKLRKMNKKT